MQLTELGVPGLRRTLGAIRGNQVQHRRAKHAGKFDPSCHTCYMQESAEIRVSREIASARGPGG